MLTLAVGALLAVPAAAGAAPVPAATVGPAYLDGAILQRLGLEVREDNAPRVVAVPKVAGIATGDKPGGFSGGPYILRQLSRGGVVLLGKNNWLYRGVDVDHLGAPEFRDDLGGRFGTRFGPFTSDGGMVGTSPLLGDGAIVGLGPDLEERWATPFTPGQAAPLSEPYAVAPGDLLYALGGTPSVVNARTGSVVAPVTGLPAGEGVSWVVGAPDGSARVLTAAVDAAGTFLTRRATLHRVGPDGVVTWSRVVAQSTGNLGLDLSPGTAGGDGETYLAVATTNGISRWDGRVIAVGVDGTVRWDTPVGDGPSRPAVDRAGNVWTATTGGRIVALSPSGAVAFIRTLAARKQGGTVAAYADGVLATMGAFTVRLVARPASASAPPATVRLATTIALQRQPFRCVAPLEGRPKTCLYRIDRVLPLRIGSPADGTAEITVEPATTILVGSGRDRRPIRPERRTMRVLTGVNMVHLYGLSGMLSVCSPGPPCTVKPRPYRVTVVLRTGGPARVFTRVIRVLPSTGRWVDQ